MKFEAEVHGHIHNALTSVLSLTFSDDQCYTHDRNAMNQTQSTLDSTILPSNLPLFKFFDDRGVQLRDGGPEAQGRRGGHEISWLVNLVAKKCVYTLRRHMDFVNHRQLRKGCSLRAWCTVMSTHIVAHAPTYERFDSAFAACYGG